MIEPTTPDTETQTREWKSCCFQLDKDVVRFFSQLGFISCILVLCIYKLATSSECTVQISYTSLLTLILGIFVPSPIIRRT